MYSISSFFAFTGILTLGLLLIFGDNVHEVVVAGVIWLGTGVLYAIACQFVDDD